MIFPLLLISYDTAHINTPDAVHIWVQFYLRGLASFYLCADLAYFVLLILFFLCLLTFLFVCFCVALLTLLRYCGCVLAYFALLTLVSLCCALFEDAAVLFQAKIALTSTSSNLPSASSGRWSQQFSLLY